jgi:Delta7-sterol 5-desaturase
MSGGALQQWLVIVGASVLVTAVTFWGIGGLVHYWFYVRRRGDAQAWKLQPKRFLGPAMTRHAFFLGSGNILMGSVLGGTFAWYVARGGPSSLYFGLADRGLWYLPVSAVLLLFAIDAALYYSHRLLHHRTIFRYVHRWHHRYTAPVIFTTTAVHPAEFLTFQFFLILPALVIPAHVGVYIAVIAYTYFIGMVDHAGVRVRWKLPLHSDNRFHDDHHVHFHCNYGHHTALFDRMHGTVRRADRTYGEHVFGGRGAPAPGRAQAAAPSAPSAPTPEPVQLEPGAAR